MERDSLTLPPVYINAIANLTNIGASTGSILLSPLTATQSGIITDFVPLQWSTNSPGTTTATERLYYSTSLGAFQNPQTCGQLPLWVGPFDTQTGILPGESNRYSSLDVRNLVPGTYYICVDATAPDAYSATVETGIGTQVKVSGKSYIKLE